MNVRVIIPCIVCAVVCVCGILRAQDAAPEQQPSPASVETQAAAPAQPAKAAEASKPAAPASAPKTPAAPAAAPSEADSLTLQDMTDGDFRYARIQGMTFEKKKILAAGEEAKPDAGVKDQPSVRNGWVVKVAFISIVILVFLLYRLGKRGRHRRVFRKK